MCFGGGAPKPANTPAITPVIQPSQAVDAQTTMDADTERRRLQALAGQQSTILTGGSGVQTPTGGYKTLIGS